MPLAKRNADDFNSAKRLSIALQDIDDFQSEQGLSDQRKRELTDISRQCGDVLKKLETTEVLICKESLDGYGKSLNGTRKKSRTSDNRLQRRLNH